MENGITRREFDDVKRRLDGLEEHSPAVLAVKVEQLRERVAGLTRAFWTLVVVVLTGLVSLIVALASGAFGGSAG